MPLLSSDKRFAGYWSDRIDGLFDIGVDYSGKKIIDIGSNMGIVAYEIAKRGPAAIHGIDYHWPHVMVSRYIFAGVPIQSRFDKARVGRSRLNLEDSYDVSLWLAVYLHIVRKYGSKKADIACASILERCTSTAIIADVDGTREDFIRLAKSHGFDVASVNKRSARSADLYVLERV